MGCVSRDVCPEDLGTIEKQRDGSSVRDGSDNTSSPLLEEGGIPILAVVHITKYLHLTNVSIFQCFNVSMFEGNYTCEVEWNGNPLSVTHTLTVLQVWY